MIFEYLSTLSLYSLWWIFENKNKQTLTQPDWLNGLNFRLDHMFRKNPSLKFYLRVQDGWVSSHKRSYNLYKWPYKWVSLGVITLLKGATHSLSHSPPRYNQA